jgi:hypothetical protein
MALFEPASQNPGFDILYQQYLARQKNTEDLLTVVGGNSSLVGDFDTLEDVVAAIAAHLPVEVAPVTLSGTSTELATGIPSWASDVYVSFNSASTDGTSNHIVQLGTSGGFVTTGYIGVACRVINAGATAGTANSNGFRLTDSNIAAGSISGVLHLRRDSSASNIWIATGIFSPGGGGQVADYLVAGVITLSGALTQIRWSTAGGSDSADAGTGAVKYFA